MASINREKRRILISRSLRREVMLFAVIGLGYLVQVCIMPYFRIAGSTPLFTICVTAVVTVCYGRMRAFWCGAIYGILFEVMQPSHQLISLLLYPASALLCSVLFADKSMQQLEYERSLGKAGRNRNPILRTVLCAMLNMLIYEVVNLVYIYLRESLMTRSLIMTGLGNIIYTTLLTLVFVIPLRLLFGYPIHQEEPVFRRGMPSI